MILGAIGPWAKVTVFGATITANGFDRDGVIVLICAVLVAMRLFVARGWAFWVAAVAATISTATSVYDYFDVAGTEGVSVGWGLWLALLASIASLGIIIADRRRGAAVPETTNAPLQ